jgi:hypothetical protein
MNLIKHVSIKSFGPQNNFFKWANLYNYVTAAYKIAIISLIQLKINLAKHLLVRIVHPQY